MAIHMTTPFYACNIKLIFFYWSILSFSLLEIQCALNFFVNYMHWCYRELLNYLLTKLITILLNVMLIIKNLNFLSLTFSTATNE